jgi:hypothetical protein
MVSLFEVWRQGKTSADMQLDIERGARLAICETATISLRGNAMAALSRHYLPECDFPSSRTAAGGALRFDGRVAYPGTDAGSRSRMGTRQMIVESDGRLALITEEHPAPTEHPSADRTPDHQNPPVR